LPKNKARHRVQNDAIVREHRQEEKIKTIIMKIVTITTLARIFIDKKLILLTDKKTL
jgi:hypothetical protein